MAYVTPRPTPGPTGDFLLFRKRQAVVRKFREMVEGAQKEVIVSASEMCVVRGSRFLIDAYRDRAKAGVAIRVSTRMTSQNQAAAEVDRYIAWPGQALSYYLGELAILRAREKAEKELGTKFNIRAFHDAVLELGSVPLPVLTARIDRLIADGGKGPYPDME